MNTITRTATRSNFDLEALAWIALVVAAVTVLLIGSLQVRATNAAQNTVVSDSRVF